MQFGQDDVGAAIRLRPEEGAPWGLKAKRRDIQVTVPELLPTPAPADQDVQYANSDGALTLILPTPRLPANELALKRPNGGRRSAARGPISAGHRGARGHRLPLNLEPLGCGRPPAVGLALLMPRGDVSVGMHGFGDLKPGLHDWPRSSDHCSSSGDSYRHPPPATLEPLVRRWTNTNDGQGRPQALLIRRLWGRSTSEAGGAGCAAASKLKPPSVGRVTGPPEGAHLSSTASFDRSASTSVGMIAPRPRPPARGTIHRAARQGVRP